MVKVNLGGCSSFVKDADYKVYVEKALAALEVLENETGKGNDFLGWKHLPSETLNSNLVAECEAVRDAWKAKNVDLVVVIGIGGSYLGAKCALEALSHQFAKQLKTKGDAPEIVFAGQNLSEEYMCELMDLVQERNAACVVISKSGTTTEPAVAFRLVKKYLEETYGKAEAAERIVAVTDKARGALKSLSTQEGYKTFVIEDNVGGRFSVLTPVGAVVGEGFLGNFDDSIGIKTNTFDIVWSNSSNITINGNIAILTFKINDTASFGKTKVAISFTQTDTFDEEWSDVNFICSDFLVFSYLPYIFYIEI